MSARQGNGYALHVALVNETGLVCLTLPLPAEQPHYPDISQYLPCGQPHAACRV